MLTISKQPQARTPAYNDQWVIGVSNQTAIADFYYKIEVKVAGVVISTEKVFKRPDNGFRFNAIEKVKNYIKHYFNPTETIIVESVDKAISVQVVITEFYSGVLRTVDKVTISYIAFDGCLKELDFANYNYTTYTQSILLGEQLLNQSDTVADPATDLFVHFFGNTVTKVHIFTLSGGIDNDYDLLMPVGYSSDKIYSLNVGARTLLTLPVTPVSGMYVLITFYNGATSLGSFNYTFSDICTKYTPLRLYYMSRSGRILYKQTELLSSGKVSKKTNDVQLNKGAISNVWDREVLEVSNITTYSKTLNTNWITESQSASLDELFDSPLVWIYENGQYLPVKITDTNYDYKLMANDPLFNLIINVEYSQKETRQRAI